MAPHGPKPGDWLSTRQACERLGITLRTLYKLIDEGDLPAYKLGRVIRLQGEDVAAWIESARIAPGMLGHLYPHRGEEDGDERGA